MFADTFDVLFKAAGNKIDAKACHAAIDGKQNIVAICRTKEGCVVDVIQHCRGCNQCMSQWFNT